MLVAFLGTDGMSAPTYAALLAATGFSALSQPAAILGVGDGSDSPFLTAQRIANSIQQVERGCDFEAAVRSALREHQHVVIVTHVANLSWLLTKGVRFVIVVEATRAHELMAIAAIQSIPRAISVLRWGHADHNVAIGKAAEAFRHTDAKVLSAAVPALNRRETDALLDFHDLPRLRRLAVQLAIALTDDPDQPGIKFDERGIGDRLRELADDIEAIEEGVAPIAEDLLTAPVLTGWSKVPHQVPVLAGFVAGHPSIENLIMTSQVYASDGQTWARTLSRWYRLGRPFDPSKSTPVQ
jgi:hypothetical protein